MQKLQADDDPSRPGALGWEQYERLATDRWLDLLDTSSTELPLHEFLERHPCMIPGGSGDVGPGGHHGSAFGEVFSEPRLQGIQKRRNPDFMWVTRSTSLVTPILIEIENPSKRWFKKNGDPTAELTQARSQITEWRSWFRDPSNQTAFRNAFVLGSDKHLHRALEPQYLLVYGRASEFTEAGGHADPQALRLKRDEMRGRAETFMTLDSLRPRTDHRHSLSVKLRTDGPEAVAFSPVYGTDTDSGRLALTIRGLDSALAGSDMMSDDRRKYLRDRFDFWRTQELELRVSQELAIRNRWRPMTWCK